MRAPKADEREEEKEKDCRWSCNVYKQACEFNALKNFKKCQKNAIKYALKMQKMQYKMPKIIV